MIEAGLQVYLLADANIAAVVGDRVFRGYRPQGKELPYLVWRVVSGPSIYDLSGLDPWDQARIQIDLVARTALQKDSLYAAVDESLNDFGGLMGTVQVRSCTRENRTDLDEVDGDRQRFRASVDYEIWYER